MARRPVFTLAALAVFASCSFAAQTAGAAPGATPGPESTIAPGTAAAPTAIPLAAVPDHPVGSNPPSVSLPQTAAWDGEALSLSETAISDSSPYRFIVQPRPEPPLAQLLLGGLLAILFIVRNRFRQR